MGVFHLLVCVCVGDPGVSPSRYSGLENADGCADYQRIGDGGLSPGGRVIIGLGTVGYLVGIGLSADLGRWVTSWGSGYKRTRDGGLPRGGRFISAAWERWVLPYGTGHQWTGKVGTPLWDVS